jgi:hypothetical protein
MNCGNGAAKSLCIGSADRFYKSIDLGFGKFNENR